ncbi:hypothetical protein DPMN_172627 [Dreissena polymorpha]|uniref:Uncharacterized protein n=1 Tax=Dreissena polymorpha TaxID=45954 RepID=A0A9D4E1Z2_DREPO|nr:hypothetical protein DPMN_172627 [Dreissena polymorpha]
MNQPTWVLGKRNCSGGQKSSHSHTSGLWMMCEAYGRMVSRHLKLSTRKEMESILALNSSSAIL